MSDSAPATPRKATSARDSVSVKRGVSYVHQPCLLLFHPSMKHLAERIVACGAPPPPLSNKRSKIQMHEIQWNFFEDGFPNLFIEDVKDVAGRDVCLLASFHSPAVIFEQMSLIYEIPRYMVRSFTLILAYFPTGTMERVDIEGQVASAKTLARMLSLTPLTAHGPPQLVIYDIHALQERFYFADSIIPRLESAVPLLLDRLQKLPDLDDVAIAFPDEGAHKRFHTWFEEDFPVIICHKVRDGDRRIVSVKEGDCKGKHVIIVDDLVKSGGTLINCGKAMQACGATSLSIFVTHAVFPQESWRRFVAADDPDSAGSSLEWKYVWVTDSVPNVSSVVANKKPFELLSLATQIADLL